MKKTTIIISLFAQAMLGQTYTATCVKDINASGGSGISSITITGSKAIFTANDGVNGNEPWITDGTNAGTFMLKDINPGMIGSVPNSSGASNFMINGAQVLFTANNSTGNALWSTDGTAAGTVLLKQFSAAGTIGSLLKLGSNFFFMADDGANGVELWKTDGSAAGTVLVMDINTGGSSYPQYMCVFGSSIYFQADDGVHGAEMWVTDGTTNGTMLFDDILPGSAGSFPSNFFVFNGKMYFGGYDQTNFQQLWSSDGTLAGTGLLKVINPSANALPGQFFTINNIMVFQAENVIGNGELWASDGSAAGTTLLKDIDGSTSSSSAPTNFFTIGNKTYFSANDGVYGRELWSTDGTTAGTILESDINAGNQGSNPGALYFDGAQIFLSANNGSGAAEMYTYSPLNHSVTLYYKINQAGASNPSIYFNLGAGLYSVATGAMGSELYRIELVIYTGLQNLTTDPGLVLYPNPTISYISIMGMQVEQEYTITDEKGAVQDKGMTGEIKDVRNLAVGVYYVQVSGKSIKFIKQ